METYASKKIQSWLSWFLKGILIIGFLVLVSRLFELQIIKGNYFKTLSEGNRIKRIPISAPRGRILARGGQILASNKEVKKGLVFDEKEGYIKSDKILDADEVITEYVRDYPFGEKAAHITGYLGEATEEEVGKINPECPHKSIQKLGQLIGRSGLEEQYECVLSGFDGEELIEVDSSGKTVRVLGTREPIPGKDIETLIHAGLQKKVAESMEDKKGAVIITDTNGEVLAFYSSPSFDPNIFVKNNEDQKIIDLLKDNTLPFFNRVIGGAFHPGSVFKPLIAIAGLEEGVIDKDYTFVDEGRIELKTLYGDFEYTNWYFTQYGATEGEIDLIRAIARSTDTFFYKLGELIGIDDIEKWAKKFSLNEKTGIDLPGEIISLIPDPEWKKRIKGEKWFLGNTYHLSIGQGDIALTPIAVNLITSVIASNGKLCMPRISEEPECREVDISRQNIKIVKDGMISACSTGGTAFPFFDFDHEGLPEEGKVACKTGTAETNKEDVTHAWFTLFAPAELPELVGTFLIEEGGEGSRDAAPVAKQVFDYWFGVNKNP